jgi:hypothetical protein
VAPEDLTLAEVVIEAEPTALAFNSDAGKRLEKGLPVSVTNHWGGKITLHKDSDIFECVGLRLNHRTVPSGPKLFEEKYKQVFTDTERDGGPKPEEALKLAHWCLAHGLVDAHAKVMDRLLELKPDLKKSLPAATAYAAVRDELKKPVTEADVGTWTTRLPGGYAPYSKPGYHYTVLFGGRGGDSQSEHNDSVLEQLERNFRAFYYWWAMQGEVLPMPAQRQLAVIAEKKEDFLRFHNVLTPAPLVADAFFARREGLLVLAPKRMDEPYDALSVFSQRWWESGFDRKAMLRGRKSGPGVPQGMPVAEITDAHMLALVMRTMEVNRDRTAATHDGTRQLLFASGMLPRNVAVPEWVQFGTASLFETPLDAPWPAVGTPSFEWLPLFKEHRRTFVERTPYETLKAVVTDALFRALPARGRDAASRKAHAAAEERARTLAWSLAYFLAHQKRAGALAYFRELHRMPRDMELDEQLLLSTFARAFGMADRDGKPNSLALARLADEWLRYVDNESLETEDIHKQMHDEFVKVAGLIAERNRSQDPNNRPGGRGPGGRGLGGAGGGGGGS